MEAVVIVRGLLKNRSLLEIGKPLDGKHELAMDPETVMMMAKQFEIGLEREHMELEEPGLKNSWSEPSGARETDSPIC